MRTTYIKLIVLYFLGTIMVECPLWAKYSGGTGETLGDPYQIADANDWNMFTRATEDKAKFFILTQDIDFGGAELRPVLLEDDPFNGNFNGNYHKLQNAVIDWPDVEHVGLFARVGSAGEIYNLCIENIYVQGHSAVGGLCGENKGKIRYCSITGSGDSDQRIGGFGGINFGEIHDCYAQVNVNGLYPGGFCGKNDENGTIARCYSSGFVSGFKPGGGFCGSASNLNNITSCFWDVQTSGESESQGGTGKTTAEMMTQSTFTDAGWDFVDKFVDGDDEDWWMSLGDYPKIVTAWADLVVYNSTEGMSGEEKEWGWHRKGTDTGYVWFRFDVHVRIAAHPWTLEFVAKQNWKRPIDLYVDVPREGKTIEVFYTHHYCGGSGTSLDPYQICTIDNWQWLMNPENSWHWNMHFILKNNIDFGGINLTPVAPDTDSGAGWFQGTRFTGEFDGGCHRLQNVVINLPAQDYVGLFGSVGENGWVKNLRVENITITGRDFCGGLCGTNETGKVSDCSVMGPTIITGQNYLGGLCGGNTWGGNITASYAIGTIQGNSHIGGFCGYNFAAKISDSYADSSVIGGVGSNYLGGLCGWNTENGVISTCYSTGKVQENWKSTIYGGFCGGNLATINGCFWDTQTSEHNDGVGNQDPDPSGVVGKPTADMQKKQTFTDVGWDFADVWGIIEYQRCYPFLKGCELTADLNSDGKVDLLDFVRFSEQWMQMR